MEAKFSAPVQTDPGDQPSTYTLGIRAFPGVKRPRSDADHLAHLVPRLKKEYGHICTPRLYLHGRIYGALYLYIYIITKEKERIKIQKYV
jgi:hypothetical protein